jgi:hypothetical protein
MCTFNTLVLPAPASIERVNEIARATLRQTFAAQGNESIEAAVGRGARSFVRDGGYCDCGAGLAKIARQVDAGPTERELRKLRADGWSVAKIERWKAQRAATHQKREAVAEGQHAGTRAIAEVWAELLRRTLEERVAPWVGVLTHEYRGSIANERIACTVQRLAGVTVEQLGEVEEDVVYVFAAA